MLPSLYVYGCISKSAAINNHCHLDSCIGKGSADAGSAILALFIASPTLAVGLHSSFPQPPTIIRVCISPCLEQQALPLYPTLQIHTLFPSPKTEEGIKGGVVLLRMVPPAVKAAGGVPSVPLALSATYRDRSGRAFAAIKEVKLPEGLLGAVGNFNTVQGAGAAAAGARSQVAPLFQSSGVRKAVALARYVDALQSWWVGLFL